ncbi:dnaJ homolog subfamily C member 1 [Eucyclogobius newberryi]|uniref:dnaJ homolog subfamily C member 1 n=1 Tax=Eucyclogobius newberryi TaxID=166745 RepID=UPI003B5BCC9D
MSVPGPRRLLPGLLPLLLPLLLWLSGGSASSGAWEPDLELLDLVEEVPQSFYQLLSLDQDALAGDIKKAYRRLSLVLHPDKNKEPDAEDKFRQLVAVYEVLKDDERRRRYDDILLHGLPDWKQPVFYYRRVRKMSNGELALLLCIICTIAHYTVLWSIYLEKLLDDLLSRKKREKKKKTSFRAESDRAQQRPHWQDLLPLKLSMWLYISMRNLPQTIQELKYFYEEQQLMKKQLQEEQEKDQEPQTRERKVKVKKSKVEFPVYDPALNTGTGLQGYDPVTSIEDIEDQMDDWLQEKKHKKKVSDWSQEELSLLSRLMVKFPGGSPGRWERIAHELNRTVAQVTAKVKQVKEHVSHTPSGLVKRSELKAPPPVTSLPADCDITQREGVASDEEGEDVAMRRRSQAKVRSRRQADFDPDEQEVEEPPPGPTYTDPTPSGPVPWTQNQQRLLESALQQFPRGTSERWTQISAVVPGKTKEECMSRYKMLAELVQKRKQAKIS